MSDIPTPVNDGNLPLDIEYDFNPITRVIGAPVRIRVAWRGYTIREQFPWTRALGEHRGGL